MDKLQQQIDLLFDLESNERFMNLKEWSKHLYLEECFKSKQEEQLYYQWLEEYNQAVLDFIVMINNDNYIYQRKR